MCKFSAKNSTRSQKDTTDVARNCFRPVPVRRKPCAGWRNWLEWSVIAWRLRQALYFALPACASGGHEHYGLCGCTMEHRSRVNAASPFTRESRSGRAIPTAHSVLARRSGRSIPPTSKLLSAKGISEIPKEVRRTLCCSYGGAAKLLNAFKPRPSNASVTCQSTEYNFFAFEC